MWASAPANGVPLSQLERDVLPADYPYPFSERAEVVPLVPPSARTVLDVGCGLGGFGAALRRTDPTRTIWGIEYNSGAAAQAALHYDRVLTGEFPEVLTGSADRFDCIVFNDVLEHMVDPWSAIRQGAALLEPDGTVLASIPNVRYLRTVVDLVVRGNWAYTDAGVLDRTHLRFFTRRTAVDLVRGAGLTVEHVQGINWIGHTRSPVFRLLPVLLRDFAYTGFLIVGRAHT